MIVDFSVAIALLLFHTPAGKPVYVNPDEITNVHEPIDNLLSSNVHCVIGLTNGKFISLSEDCTTVHEAINANHQMQK